ncbi:MAG TPA: acyltransferase [Candidatus Binataceae bacterium]|nr:acyltransferase [Candidatus Binataceae bacterium]
MAVSETARATIDAAEQAGPRAVARPSYNVAIGYLRGFLVVMVLAHHSVLAYVVSKPPLPQSLAIPPLWWRAFPIVDSQHSIALSLFTGFNDDFFMSLMFLLSGLFVWSSLKRKGSAAFTRDRMGRLGIPFLFAAAIVAPLAYYPTYLTTGAHGIAGYAREWMAFGDWPTGPAWFIWLLLAFDLAVAAIFLLMPNFGDALARWTSNARQHPMRFFVGLLAASCAVYIPMAAVFGPSAWTSIGPFQFQTPRLLHYAVYFAAGIGIGAHGIDSGLLAADGILAHHWPRWTLWAMAAFVASIGFFALATTSGAAISPALLTSVGGVFYATVCASISIAFLALFVRFATRRRWLFDTISDNEYGVYLIHYAFVSWLQFAMLSAPLSAIEKGSAVFIGTLILSWMVSAAMRSIPAVSRIV